MGIFAYMTKLNELKDPVLGAVDKMALPTISWALSVLGTSPVWTGMLVASSALYGYYLQFQQDKLNKFIQFIVDHPNEFAESIIQQPSFQEGFFLTLETYLRVRSDKKRRLIQKVFLGFAEEEYKEDFDLERLYETIKLITTSQIECLRTFDQKDRYIQLSQQREDSYKDHQHEQYQDIRSLEGLGIIMMHTDIAIEMVDSYSGDRESGLERNKDRKTVSDKTESAELTCFGKTFLTYLKQTD